MRTLPILFIVVLVAMTPAAAATTTIYPQAFGTVRSLPNLNILEVWSLGFPVDSTCFSTTDVNLEWRRGFAEFGIPVFSKGIKRATITVTDWNAVFSATPLPPDVHEVSYYPADLVVDVADYDRPATLIGTFMTDANDQPRRPPSFSFDVTQAVRQAQGSGLGFRIKLQIDPAGPCVDFAGAEIWPITLEIVAASEGSSD